MILYDYYRLIFKFLKNMFNDKIKMKRKNRFINITDEETKLNNYKRKSYYKINLTKPLFKVNHYSLNSFNRKVVLPLIILIIFFVSYSSLRKGHSHNYLTKEDIIKNNLIKKKNIYKGKERLSREMALARGRNYLDKCLEGLLFNHKTFIISNEPKITAIIPLFNDEKMIKKVVRSIQNQKMTDIEIILVNDNSKDNSLNIIKEIKKEDPRIIIINNEKNMGTLYSRSAPVLEAKGKYILNLDQDDFFLDEDLFDTLYEEAEEGKFDIVSFMELEINNYDAKINEMYDGICTNHPDNLIVRQPELTHFTLFKNGSFSYVDVQIWGKLIKTEVYKKAINLLGKERYSTYNIVNEDLVAVFSICLVAESYKYVRKYGIFHLVNHSTTYNKISHEHDRKMAIFFSEIVFDLSKNEDKKYAVNMVMKIYPPNQELKDYLGNVLRKIIDCEYINENDKDRVRKKYKEIGF